MDAVALHSNYKGQLSEDLALTEQLNTVQVLWMQMPLTVIIITI
jgi:hypothetical protein